MEPREKPPTSDRRQKLITVGYALALLVLGAVVSSAWSVVRVEWANWQGVKSEMLAARELILGDAKLSFFDEALRRREAKKPKEPPKEPKPAATPAPPSPTPATDQGPKEKP